MMGLRPRQGNLRLVFRLSKSYACLGLNPIIDSINLKRLLEITSDIIAFNFKILIREAFWFPKNRKSEHKPLERVHFYTVYLATSTPGQRITISVYL